MLWLVPSPGTMAGDARKECSPGGWVLKSNLAVGVNEKVTLLKACLFPYQPNFLGTQQGSSDFYEETYTLEPLRGSSPWLLAFPPSPPSVASWRDFSFEVPFGCFRNGALWREMTKTAFTVYSRSDPVEPGTGAGERKPSLLGAPSTFILCLRQWGVLL